MESVVQETRKEEEEEEAEAAAETDMAKAEEEVAEAVGGCVREDKVANYLGEANGSYRISLARRLASGLSYWAPIGPRKPSGASRFSLVEDRGP